MPRYLLVTCERGTLVPKPDPTVRRYCGKPRPGPMWADDEQPVIEVVPDDPALRKAHKNPGDKFTILKEGAAKDLGEARKVLMPAAAPSAPVRATKKGGE